MTRFIQQLYQSILPSEVRKHLHKLRHYRGYQKFRSEVFHSDQGDFSIKPYDEHLCIFVHITKTAGTSVAKSLFGYLPYHYTARHYQLVYGANTFRNYYKFAFVRNPWDRLYSAYRYLKAGGWNEQDKQWAQENLAAFDDFNHFVQHWLNEDNIKKHIHFKPQHEFICDRKGNIMLDYLAYFETINDDFNFIAKKLGINAQLGKHNTNPADSYISVYDDISRELVASVYAEDIHLFGYAFDAIKQRRILSASNQ